MFTISFKSGTVPGAKKSKKHLYNEEYLRNDYLGINIKAQIGQTFMDFISLTGDISKSNHPYLTLADNAAEQITENSWFFRNMREYLDLCIDNVEFLSVDCFMYFLEISGTSIPTMHYELPRTKTDPDEYLEDAIELQDGMSPFEHSMRAFLAAGDQFFDLPITVYTCETIEDVCVASMHFLITQEYKVKKCGNCGGYFIPYKRSDAVYCDRISPFNSNLTCKADGAKRTHKAMVDNDVVLKRLYDIETARRMVLYRAGYDIDLEREFYNWKMNANYYRDKYKWGEISAEQFLAWLEENKHYPYDLEYSDDI